MASNPILKMFEGGDRRSIGCADGVAEMLKRNRRLFPQLIAGLWSADPLVRMRTADATEKVSREKPELLLPYKKPLLALLRTEEQAEVRWHLAVMVPRLRLNVKERAFAMEGLLRYLQEGSSMVKTFALQGLADLARTDAGIRSGVIEILREATRNGSAAMKARSRKLLGEIGED